MRTTLDLDDELVKEIKRRAADSGRTMTQELEDVLREGLRSRAPEGKPFRLRLPVFKGKLLPGVDLNDRDSLYDIMEGRR
ncbi:MAG TPA: ribbon-helix-helix protein, CopG family [Thermoanaerobaculia bacterium]|jgi:plasmid stability protein|nr:ribbon-helix-helix protein, CopG family [Thermoanaerobaculia bacterium]